MMVPRGNVLPSLVSGYWGRHSSGTGFGLQGKAAFYFTYPAGLIRGQLNQMICSRSLRDSVTQLGEESWTGKTEKTSSHRGIISQYHLSKLEGQPIVFQSHLHKVLHCID